MRTVVRVVAATLGAAIGAVVGIVVGFVLFIVLVEGGPEFPSGALVRILTATVPIGLVAGGAAGWRVARKSAP